VTFSFSQHNPPQVVGISERSIDQTLNPADIIEPDLTRLVKGGQLAALEILYYYPPVKIKKPFYLNGKRVSERVPFPLSARAGFLGLGIYPGILTSVSPYSPLLPRTCSSGLNADFVNGHSCGAATVSHRLPQSISFYV
jgi:hypothetical protein